MTSQLLSGNLVWLWALLGGWGVFAAFYAVSFRRTAHDATASVPARDRIPAGPGASLAYRLAARQGKSDQHNALAQQLQAANWYWAPGEATPPDRAAPFHSVRGYRATCAYQALVYGVLGLLLSSGLLAALTLLNPEATFNPAWLWLAPPVVGLMGFVGYTGPSGQLTKAVQLRQHRLTVELAFRLPELAALVSTGRSTIQALRLLTARPGGPFTTEMARLLRVYDATMSLDTAIQAVVAYNRFPPLSEFLQQVLLVEQRGGVLGPVLQVQAEGAQAVLQRRLMEQGLRNAGQMEMPVVVGSLMTVMGLVGGPALWMLLTYL